MPSVTRDRRRTISVGGKTAENEKRERLAREEAREEELRRDRDQRNAGEYYHHGRLYPLIDDEEGA